MPSASAASSRSYVSIVVGNVVTVFNVILATFGGLTLAFGHPEDAGGYAMLTQLRWRGVENPGVDWAAPHRHYRISSCGAGGSP
jgi:hypothetical protein